MMEYERFFFTKASFTIRYPGYFFFSVRGTGVESTIPRMQVIFLFLCYCLKIQLRESVIEDGEDEESDVVVLSRSQRSGGW